MAEERKQIARVWIWLGAAVVLVVVFFVARSLTRDKMPIHAAVAARTELVSTVSTNGLIEPEKNYQFHAPLATSVRAVFVQQGDHVPAGKLLMQLDDVNARARVADAESALQSAQATDEALRQGGTLEERQSLKSDITRASLDEAQDQRELTALEKLQSNGAASASEVAASRQRLALAQQNLQTLQARETTRYSPSELGRGTSSIANARAALDAAREVLNETTIHAPVAGTVYSIPVGASDFVPEGQLLMQVADLHHVRVRAYFDEPEIGRLAVGQKIRIVWDARPGREWHGHIVLVPSTIITYGTRNVGEVLVAIDDADDDLLPDTHVTVTVTTSSQPNVLTVPREALHSENGQPYVYRVVNDVLVRTKITIGTPNLTEVPVNTGLNDGDRVATGSLNDLPLEDGLPVKVIR